MALFIASLNSGSNGNCYYIGNERDAVLIDAGISCRETERRMLRLGLSMKKVRAIFVSHEHSDHISGITVLSKKYDLPVYITPATLQSSGLHLAHHLPIPFSAHEPVMIGDIAVLAFPKFHDAAHAHSFMVEYNDVKVGVLTDIGAACEHVKKHFSQCHAAFLEANYDEEMLEKGRYPYHLKRRIRGGLGHLSNTQALEIFINHRSPHLSHLLLSHLSRDNNRPELVHELFSQHANGTEIIVASRYEESAVYHISGLPLAEQKPVTIENGQMQYSLF
ncbi:MBL fold metallo-hydrolase [Mucilaginibacter sp. BT774]|uniref:MBL fold metallo-hydrolase n=1 Tax=Mucilaginibacter sp. BT774 TaxID=3062276 RepID=UPI0026769971|nr:MBL fold metallo-hydrolase [Mucilaginibacter sp. BT774]MDO3626537.1 MBL fold metallo-hydrolase [Mucilaginibacter sp. BT774]